MLRMIASAALGFLTLPIIGLFIFGLIEGGKFLSVFELPAAQYWSGFFLLIGLAVVVGCVVVFIEA